MPKKQEKKTAKKEPKKKAAPAKTQNPEAERNALTVKIEGDLPYNRQVYVNEVRFLMKQTAEAIIEIGKRLLVIKEKEGKGDFMKVVEEEIGIPYRTAFRFMNTALKASKFPVIQQLATVASCNKVYTLLEAPEEDLKELEEKGVLAGKDMDELHRMSVKEMREFARKLRDDRDAEVKKLTGKLEAQLETAKQTIKEYSEMIPAKATTKTDKALALADGLYEKFDSTMNFIVFETLEIEDGSAVSKTESMLQKWYSRITHKMEELQKHKRGELRS